jgi:succinate dehydrogenase/fumarate reductase flavoprotein subunit
LEGLVFGARAARAMLTDALPFAEIPEAEPGLAGVVPDEQIEEIVQELKQTMDQCAGLLREEDSLRKGLMRQARCAEALDAMARTATPSRQLVEAQSLCTVAEVILHSALARTESRGGHSRTDYPRRDDEHFQKHSIYRCDQSVTFAN